ncbi:MAG: lipid A export permease/ATP-binding protein MsbA [Desulfobacteraceae bacterium]|jgi:subfamily B ATP-binding cassette protein MsbA|nr:MAG: lipid A export permease/ATP-binding protein MsbA [Desulfobacteraceae bacterium]
MAFSFTIRQRHRELFKYIRENWISLFLASICMIVVALTTSATAYLVKPVLDDIFLNKKEDMLKFIPLLVIGIFFLRGLGMYGQEYLMHYVGERIIKQLRNALYARIIDLPLAFFHKERTGGLMSRITNDVGIIKNMVSKAVTGGIGDFFTIIGLLVLIFYRDWKLAIIAIMVFPLAIVPIVEFGRRVRRYSRRSQESMADLNAFLHETFAGNKVVKAFGMENDEKQSFVDKSYRVFRFELKAVRANALTSPVMEILGGTGIALVILYGGYGVFKGTSTPGTFFSFIAAVMFLYPPVKKLTKLNNVIQQGMAAVDRIFDILETESDIKDKPSPVHIATTPHHITFENVGFSYDGSEMVLKDINLAVAPGEILAIVGSSGGGKTSMVNLIPRFYDVTTGAVRIDGIDIRDLSIATLREQIAIVTQEAILFNDTIRHNIAYGRRDAAEEEIADAARAAYIYDFIQSLPKGFDTGIGELGSRLSGGEKQRMCIARALLKNAPILILDEATAALDTESERLVQKALENLMKGRTSFVIAHRLSTISYADRIIVVSGGRIVEQGTHTALLAEKGEYHHLHQMQFTENRETDAPL